MTLSTFKKLFICTTEFISSKRFIWIPIWQYLERWFFHQKRATFVETQKLCHHRLNHLIFHQGKNWKIDYIILYIISKKFAKISLVFSRKFKKLSNSLLFEGALMRRRIYPTRWFWSRTLHIIWIFLYKKTCLTFIYYPQVSPK